MSDLAKQCQTTTSSLRVRTFCILSAVILLPACGRDQERKQPRQVYAEEPAEGQAFPVILPEISREELASDAPVQFLSFGSSWTPSRVLTVALVDDTPSDEGENMRNELASERSWAQTHSASDPGLATPWVEDVAFVPTGTGTTVQLVVSSDYSTTRVAADDEKLESYVDDSLAVYEELQSESIEPMGAIDAALRILNVLAGTSPPANEFEERMLMRDYEVVYLRFAITRDDDSEWAPASFLDLANGLTREGGLPVHWSLNYFTSGGHTNASVEDLVLPLPTMSQLFLSARGQVARYPSESYLGLSRFIIDHFPLCLPTVPLLEDGEANCRAFRLFDSDAADCPEDRGWHSVSGSLAKAMRGHLIDYFTEGLSETDRERLATLHVCEVQQLTGDALTSCQNDLHCDDCEPGWCYNDQLEEHSGCRDTGNWEGSERFRFVHGAHYGNVRSSNSVVVCEELPEQP